jgi:Uma2 family endonuclease
MVTTIKPITIDNYWQLLERDEMTGGSELIGGELYEISPQSTWHNSSIRRLQTALERLFPRRQYCVTSRSVSATRG